MDAIMRYLRLIDEHPRLFAQNRNLKIVTDEAELRAHEQRSGERLGVVFENRYVRLVADLVENASGGRYAYVRILGDEPYNGVAVLPMLGGKAVFLKQFRHATREYELELPRGFAEKDREPLDNACTEIREELGVDPERMEYLGAIASDSGLRAGLVHLFVCEVRQTKELAADEGIEGVELLEIAEVDERIGDGRIRDSHSICAWYKWKLKRLKEKG